MIRRFLLPAAAGLFLLPAFADVMPMPIAGYTSGVFANPTGGSVSGGTWTYNATDSIVFAGVSSFNGNTPQSFDFGTITLNHPVNSGNATLTAELDVTVTFITPSGKLVNFADGLRLQTQNGNHTDTLELAFMGYPGPQSFTVGSETYTVTYDGFSSSSTTDTPVSSLIVDRDSSGSAYLWGTITASAFETSDPSPVPEPGSVVLLVTAFGGIVLARRRQLV